MINLKKTLGLIAISISALVSSPTATAQPNPDCENQALWGFSEMGYSAFPINVNYLWNPHLFAGDTPFPALTTMLMNSNLQRPEPEVSFNILNQNQEKSGTIYTEKSGDTYIKFKDGFEICKAVAVPFMQAWWNVAQKTSNPNLARQLTINALSSGVVATSIAVGLRNTFLSLQDKSKNYQLYATEFGSAVGFAVLDTFTSITIQTIAEQRGLVKKQANNVATIKSIVSKVIAVGGIASGLAIMNAYDTSDKTEHGRSLRGFNPNYMEDYLRLRLENVVVGDSPNDASGLFVRFNQFTHPNGRVYPTGQFEIEQANQTTVQLKALFNTGSWQAYETGRLDVTNSDAMVNNGKAYFFESKFNERCIDVENVSTSNDANIYSWSCHEAGNQRFIVQGSPTAGFPELKPSHSGKCMDVRGDSRRSDGNIQQYECNGGENQRWRIELSNEPGYFMLRNQYSNMCADIYAYRNYDGANIVQYPCNNADNQKWRMQY